MRDTREKNGPYIFIRCESIIIVNSTISLYIRKESPMLQRKANWQKQKQKENFFVVQFFRTYPGFFKLLTSSNFGYVTNQRHHSLANSLNRIIFTTRYVFRSSLSRWLLVILSRCGIRAKYRKKGCRYCNMFHGLMPAVLGSHTLCKEESIPSRNAFFTLWCCFMDHRLWTIFRLCVLCVRLHSTTESQTMPMSTCHTTCQLTSRNARTCFVLSYHHQGIALLFSHFPDFFSIRFFGLLVDMGPIGSVS